MINAERTFLIMLNILLNINSELFQKEQFIKKSSNKIANKIPNVYKTSQQKRLGILRNETKNIEHDKEMSKERYIYPEQ